jgi:hypothetical protein
VAEDTAPAKKVSLEKAATVKKSPIEKVETKATNVPAGAAASVVTSPKPTGQTKQFKKRSKPTVTTASANLFAAFMAKAKKQKTE